MYVFNKIKKIIIGIYPEVSFHSLLGGIKLLKVEEPKKKANTAAVALHMSGWAHPTGHDV